MSDHVEYGTRAFSIFLQGQIDFTLEVTVEDGYMLYGPHLNSEDLDVWVRGWNFAQDKEQRR